MTRIVGRACRTGLTTCAAFVFLVLTAFRMSELMFSLAMNRFGYVNAWGVSFGCTMESMYWLMYE